MSRLTLARRKMRGLYSKGELNRLIDGLLHPLFEMNPPKIIGEFAEKKGRGL